MEQRNSGFPPPERQPLPTPSQLEKGVFEKWFKRRKKNPENPPEVNDDSAGSTEQQSQPQPEQQKKKLGAKLLRFLGMRRNQSERFEQPEQRPQQSRTESSQSPTPESQPENPEPIIEQASRVRRFAKIVLDKVLGTAEREHQNAKKWDGEQAKPLDTEPLINAADDLRHAVEDLEAAMPQPESTSGERDSGSSDKYDVSSPDGGNYIPPVSELAPSFSAQVAERIERRIRRIEQEANKQAEQNEQTAAFAAAGIGILAVATVIIAGTEYFAHKKIKKEQKQIKRQLAEQREQQKKQEAAFIDLQQQHITDLPRRDRQVYYRELSEFTHKQADVTRQTAHELRQVEVASQAVSVRRDEKQEAVVWRRREVAQGEHDQVRAGVERRSREKVVVPEQLDPLVRIESADRVEQGSWSQRHAQQQQGALRVAGAQLGVDPRGNQQDDAMQSSQSESHNSTQSSQSSPPSEAQSWLYGAAIAALLIGFAIVFALIG